VTFDLQSVRFHFSARDAIQFPQGQAGNIWRGALGGVFRQIACAPECPGRAGTNIRECALRSSCTYAQVFEPAAISSGPSGMADWPRPFVIRAGHLSECVLQPGAPFWLSVNLFDARNPPVEHFTRAFERLVDAGLGSNGARASLVSVDQSPVTVPLEPRTEGVSRIRVEFSTPTELKSGARIVKQPEFAVLFARARDRVSSLRALYGAGPLDVDFRGLGERSRAVRIARCQLRQVEVDRRSSRTGQRHGIGGFVGVVDYEGDLAEFLPYLQAAHWTGVGRHCSWGNGELSTEVIS
jgi:hypothetical protein